MVHGQIVGYIYIQQYLAQRILDNSQTELDREGDKAVVLLDVPFEDVRAGPQDSLEPGPVELDALEGAHSGDGGGAGSVQHERDLPEVVRGSEVAHLLAGLPLLPVLRHQGVPER